jgi:hypothetical protein
MQSKAALFLVSLFTLAASGALADTALVNHGDSWRYHKGTNAPQANWKTITDATLDATWATGNGGIGYADNTAEEVNCQTLLTDMQNKYTTAYIRKQFQVSSAIDPNSHLLLTMDWDDGFIAWLDGNHLTNGVVTGAPAEPAFNAVASGNHESSKGNPNSSVITFDLGLVGSRLGVGTHTLAIMGLNVSLGSSDFIMVPDLSVGVPCPAISITANTTWRAVDSPIVVCGGAAISSGATLTIEPGTTVQLGSGADITVANGGILLANGTSNAPIHFTRSGTSGNWGQIIINGGVGSPETQIAYATFDFNISNANDPAIWVNGGTVLFDHLTFGTPGSPYIHVDSASFIIRDCFFPPATAAFEPCHALPGGIKSGGRGIFLRNFWGKAIGYSDVVDFTGGNRDRGQPIVQFINNVVAGGDDDGFDLDGTDAWVEGNIFLHMHKEAPTPDSSSAVSGGKTGTDVSQVTIIRNIMFDCDQAADAKETNFYTFFYNTIVHQNHSAGIDTDAAVIALADAGTDQGTGAYFEGNIIQDIEKFTRNVTTAVVTFTNNIVPIPWTGLGGGNVITNPLFKHVPLVSETFFTNWAQAQIMWDWFSLLPNSPAIGAGPNGEDQGAVALHGVNVSGGPTGTTSQTTATLVVGVNRKGGTIPSGGFPLGSGYTHYKWRLDSGAWSAETAIASPILLSGLADGTHRVDVVGKNDAGMYQDDPILGPDAVVTSKSWTVQTQIPLRISSFGKAGSTFTLHFTAEAGQTYTVQSKVHLDDSNWTKVQDVAAQPSTGDVAVSDNSATGATKFYRLVTPAQ